MKQLKETIGRRLRWAIHTRRYLRALKDSWSPIKASYSQDGEDLELAQFLKGLDLKTGIYIEVGANQPSYLSNTYRLYRQGLTGILVEPDAANCQLLKWFRPKDIVIQALAGSSAKLCQFNHALFSVLSSVQPLEESQILKREFIPQITIDEVVEAVNPKWIYLLSTDTEGYDLEVLRGAQQALKRTFLVCAEYHSEPQKQELEAFMQSHSFMPVLSNHLNVVFRNTALLDLQSEQNRNEVALG